MHFWKMNGAGNDFVILNNLQEHIAPEALPQLAKTLCTPHFSLGADGLMVVDAPEQGGDFRMRFYNSDGSIGEMCGNGARCICRYGFENGLAGEKARVETTAGMVTGERIDETRYRIRLNDPSVVELSRPAPALGSVWDTGYVVLGDPGIPHALVPWAHLKETDPAELRALGSALRFSEAYPKGANVNFYELLAPDHLFLRTFERGVEDFTYACGTGTGALVAALTLAGKVSGKNVRVDMAGGTLTIDAELEMSHIANLYLTGPTAVVAIGEVFV